MNTHSIRTSSAGPSESSVSRDEHSSTSHLWYTGLYLSYTFLNNSFYSEPFIYIIYNNIQYIIYNNITIYLWYIGLYLSYRGLIFIYFYSEDILSHHSRSWCTIVTCNQSPLRIQRLPECRESREISLSHYALYSIA